MNAPRARMLFLAALASCSSPIPAPSDDAGFPDAGSSDAGAPDAGTPDAGSAVDAGRLDSQENYTYSGCDDAGTYGCPRSLVFVCALNSIREQYASCQSPADCVLVSATNCFAHLTTCPPAAVNDASAAAFLAEANAEGERYCDGGTCRVSGLCAVSYQRQLVDCVSGRCVALSDDGGF